MAGDFGNQPHLDLVDRLVCDSPVRRGELSATDREDSKADSSKASSTATTPKESSRKIKFNHDGGNTPPGHYSGASWEAYERIKKRPREDGGDGDDGAIGA